MKFRFNYTEEVRKKYQEIFEAPTEKEAEQMFHRARERGELDKHPIWNIRDTETVAIEVEE